MSGKKGGSVDQAQLQYQRDVAERERQASDEANRAMIREGYTATLYFDYIYYVVFSATGRPVGNPAHVSRVDAAWHVRRNGADKTDVLVITPQGPPINLASVVPIRGIDFLKDNLAELEQRDVLEARARQSPTGVREAPAVGPLMK